MKTWHFITPKKKKNKVEKRKDKFAIELIKDGLVIKKSTSYGLHVYLNSAKSEEIKEFVKRVLNTDV